MTKYANKVKETLKKEMYLEDKLCVMFYVAMTAFISTLLTACVFAARFGV